MEITLLLLGCVVALFGFIIYQLRIKNSDLSSKVDSLLLKYGKILDIDQSCSDGEAEKLKILGDLEVLKKTYDEKHQIFENLVKESRIYSEHIEIGEWGLYKPQFSFENSEQFKVAIKENHRRQKEQLSSELKKIKSSLGRDHNWIELYQLSNYAFNQACALAISEIKWDNAVKIEERVKKAFEKVYISFEYIRNGVMVEKFGNSAELYKLKLEEIRLVHELALKKHAEKEEQAAIRQQMKENAKVEEDLRNAEKEEEKFASQLKKTQVEALKATGDNEKALLAKIEMLTNELAEARAKAERARSLAEQTRRGHVYIISNRGSFGDNIYKIGMTRRADAQVRIDELGDASVPFEFDVHAVILTDDAPALERQLHEKLENHRLNLKNRRREFFNVELSEVEKIVKNLYPNIEFNLTAEAKEFSESVAIRAAKTVETENERILKKFPKAI